MSNAFSFFFHAAVLDLPNRMETAAKKQQRSLRLSPDLHRTVTLFCAKTNRDEPETLRAIVRLFFAAGMKAAEDRLVAGLWDLDEAPAALSAKDDPQAVADFVVTGKMPGRTKKKGRGA